MGLAVLEDVRAAEDGLENLDVDGEGEEAFTDPDALALALPGLALALPPLVLELDSLIYIYILIIKM